jgi:predicted  nucleic acid-binding Zn ribbon protein
MSTHLFMGVINKASNELELPKFADKKNYYMCPSCEKDYALKILDISPIIHFNINIYMIFIKNIT